MRFWRARRFIFYAAVGEVEDMPCMDMPRTNMPGIPVLKNECALERRGDATVICQAM
jgi:hypothetical protein